MLEVDNMDRRLLRLLQEDAGQSVARLAEEAGLSTGACWRRLERLERDGVILGREVEIDYRALGFDIQVFLRVTLDKTRPDAFDSFLRAARLVPEVDEIQTLLGRVDIRLEVRARNLAHYQQIYREQILALPNISEIEALMLVSEMKNTTRIPV
jgi:Lrp/AsnC family transcriptional regulator